MPSVPSWSQDDVKALLSPSRVDMQTMCVVCGVTFTWGDVLGDRIVDVVGPRNAVRAHTWCHDDADGY